MCFTKLARTANKLYKVTNMAKKTPVINKKIRDNYLCYYTDLLWNKNSSCQVPGEENILLFILV